jgi:hypothetical protein
MKKKQVEIATELCVESDEKESCTAAAQFLRPQFQFHRQREKKIDGDKSGGDDVEN